MKRLKTVLCSRSAHVVALGVTAAVGHSFAGGINMPWNAPLLQLANNLSGSTAYLVTVIAVVATAFGLIAHGDMHEFGRKGTFSVIAGAFAMGVPYIVSLFGVSGATI